jgi:hypothetical protein
MTHDRKAGMRKHLTLVAVIGLLATGCAEPRESSSVEVTPPAVVEVPIQTVFYDALQTVLPDEAILATGQPAIESLNTAAAEIAQYSPEPAECAGTIDSKYYTTTDVAMGFHSETSKDEHAAQTIVAASFETADDASAYFGARTQPWEECSSVDLTIADDNVLTLHYASSTFADEPDLEVPKLLGEADQDMVLTSSGELSGNVASSDGADTPLPNPGALPDYVISPDEIPEPEAENIAVTNATVVVRFDTQVFWSTVEPGGRVDHALETLAAVVEAVQEDQ